MQHLTSDTAFDWPQLQLNTVGWCFVTSVLCEAVFAVCVVVFIALLWCVCLLLRDCSENALWLIVMSFTPAACITQSCLIFFFLISLHQYCPPLNYARFWLPFWCSKQHCWWYTVAPASGKAGMGLRGCCVNVNLICDLPVWWLFHLQYAYTLFRVNLKLKK